MSLPPVLYHIFKTPLPYLPTLALQNQINAWQLALRKSSPASSSSSSSSAPSSPSSSSPSGSTQSSSSSSPAQASSPSVQGTTTHHPDILLLLQHRPTYTAGRRETIGKEAEARYLRSLGADWVKSDRGGLTTFHGPGQVVGYPLVDLGRMGISARDYVTTIESLLRHYLLQTHNIHPIPCSKSLGPGIFLSPTQKLASIGVSIRHRLTSHGFSMNVTREPVAWFGRVVACGLVGVRAGCLVDAVRSAQPSESGATTGGGEGEGLSWETVAEGLVGEFGRTFGRDMRPLTEEVIGELEGGKEIWRSFERLEEEARGMGDWPRLGEDESEEIGKVDEVQQRIP